MMGLQRAVYPFQKVAVQKGGSSDGHSGVRRTRHRRLYAYHPTADTMASAVIDPELLWAGFDRPMLGTTKLPRCHTLRAIATDADKHERFEQSFGYNLQEPSRSPVGVIWPMHLNTLDRWNRSSSDTIHGIEEPRDASHLFCSSRAPHRCKTTAVLLGEIRAQEQPCSLRRA